jgi:uncharacterized alkaline shock family protein YloU
VTEPLPGRSLVTRRAVRDLVRTAVLSSYGVTGFSGGGPLGRLVERLGFGHPGLRIELGDELVVRLRLSIAYGLPVAEVARQVESSVRYTLLHGLGREPDRVEIRIGRLVHEHGIPPAAEPASMEPGPSDLAASGTDVA